MIELTHTLSPPAPAAVPQSPAGMLGAQEYLRVVGGRLAGGNDRPAFSAQVQTAIPVAAGQARCHYISYKLISKCIVAILNRALFSTAYTYRLYNLHAGVFCFSTGSEAAKDDASCSIAKLLGVSHPTADNILPEASKLLVSLNSSITNLRAGNQDWNASIGEQYDPAYWWCAVSAREYRDRSGAIKQLPSGMPDLKPGEFYLRASDNVRLGHLAPLADMLSPVGFYSAIDESGIPFVYSSNNQFTMPGLTKEYRGKINFIPDSCFTG